MLYMYVHLEIGNNCWIQKNIFVMNKESILQNNLFHLVGNMISEDSDSHQYSSIMGEKILWFTQVKKISGKTSKWPCLGDSSPD